MIHQRATRIALVLAMVLISTACNPLGTYLLSNSRTNAAAPGGLTIADVPLLEEAWSIGNGANISGQPVVAADRVYWGDWAGYARAAKLDGTTMWTQNVGSTTSCFGRIGVTSSPAIADVANRRTAFFGGGDATMYALDANTGAKIWSTRLGPSPDHFIWSSPAFYNNAIYVGVASYGACPLVRGSLVRLDATTGAITHTFPISPPGCNGGGVVASPAYDETTHSIYITTGDTSFECYQPLTQSILRLNAADLTLVDTWPIPNPDFIDADWLATPALITTTIGGVERKLVGGPAKDGTVYMMDRDRLSAGPVWSRTIAVGGADPLSGHGSIAPLAFDGTTVFAAGGNTTKEGRSCSGSLRALNPATGALKWEICLGSPVLGAPAVGNGFVVVATGRNLHFFETATARNLLTWTKPGLGMFQGPPAVVGDTVYVGNTNGELIALRKGT